jgi:hypothetical protein
MKTTKTKVGRYPLQKTGGETSTGQYESVDYLYEYPTGYVWLRTVHDLQSREHHLQLEFIHNGIKYGQWAAPLVVPYDSRMLCRAARKFAQENSK